MFRSWIRCFLLERVCSHRSQTHQFYTSSSFVLQSTIFRCMGMKSTVFRQRKSILADGWQMIFIRALIADRLRVQLSWHDLTPTLIFSENFGLSGNSRRPLVNGGSWQLMIYVSDVTDKTERLCRNDELHVQQCFHAFTLMTVRQWKQIQWCKEKCLFKWQRRRISSSSAIPLARDKGLSLVRKSTVWSEVVVVTVPPWAFKLMFIGFLHCITFARSSPFLLLLPDELAFVS